MIWEYLLTHGHASWISLFFKACNFWQVIYMMKIKFLNVILVIWLCVDLGYCEVGVLRDTYYRTSSSYNFPPNFIVYNLLQSSLLDFELRDDVIFSQSEVDCPIIFCPVIPHPHCMPNMECPN